MNRTATLAFVLAAAAAGSAFADDITVETTPFVSTATRAQVQAELAAQRQAGVNPWSTQYNPLRAFRSERTRAQVAADFVASRERVAAFTGEDSGSAFLARRDSGAAPTAVAGKPRNAQ